MYTRSVVSSSAMLNVSVPCAVGPHFDPAIAVEKHASFHVIHRIRFGSVPELVKHTPLGPVLRLSQNASTPGTGKLGSPSERGEPTSPINASGALEPKPM